MNNPDLLLNHEYTDMLSEQIGTDKFLFLDDKSKEFTIINAEQGKQNDDMWLSNTYSLEPTGGYALNRDYKYNFDTDTMVKNDIPPYGNYLYDDEWYGHYSGVSSHNRNLPTTYGNTTNKFHNPKKADTVLTADDFVRILTEPFASLTEQYIALLATEGVTVSFSEDGIRAIADAAWQVNENTENIGARRLHTMMERLIEEISFNASDRAGETINIDKVFVEEILTELVKNEDLSRFIL